jgi:hypothetical protein
MQSQARPQPIGLSHSISRLDIVTFLKEFAVKNETKNHGRSMANISFFFVESPLVGAIAGDLNFLFLDLLGYRSIVDESVVNEAHSIRLLFSLFGNPRIVAAAVCRTLQMGCPCYWQPSQHKENHHLPTVFHLCTRQLFTQCLTESCNHPQIETSIAATMSAD